jgi:Holliday junction resolvase
MYRRRVKKDQNHAEIVNALKAVGCSVLDLAAVGGGCPDLLVSLNSKTVLVEVKRPGVIGKKAGALRKAVTDRQAAFRAMWRGEIFTVDSVEAAWKALGLRA